MSADRSPAGGPSEPAPTETAEEVGALFVAKARAEIAAADALAPGSDVIGGRGNPIARVLVVKGLPGPAEAAGGAAVSGADGDALAKAFAALGYRDDDAYYALSRPQPAASSEQRVLRLRSIVEAVDAAVVVALDADAARDLSDAMDLEGLAPGRPVDASGRRYVALDGFEACLADEARKRPAWEQLRAAAPPGPVY